MIKFYVVHEYGDPSHYSGLKFLFENKYKNKVDVKYIEFSVIKKIIEAVKNQNMNLLIKQLTNIYTILKLSFLGKQYVVLGMAPFDYRIFFLKPMIRKNIIFYHTSWPCWDYINCPKTKFSSNSIIKRQWRQFIEREVKGIFAVTNAAKLSMQNFYKIKCDIAVVNHSLPWRHEWTEKIHDGEKIKIIFIGRLTKEKGIFNLFEIMNKLNEEQFELTIIGKGKLLKDIKKLKYNNVYFKDYIYNKDVLKKILLEQDVLLLPSMKTGVWEESFGMVIIEALSCNNIVISTNHKGPSEVVENGKTVYLFSETEYVENTVSVLKYIFKNREILNEMKSNAKKAAFKYDIENIAVCWDRIIRLFYFKKS